MSRNLIHTTKEFIKVVQPTLGTRNLSELETSANNILSEYLEILDLQRQMDDLIAQQLELADNSKTQLIQHWQTSDKSKWIELHETYHKKRDDFSRKIDNYLNHYYSYVNFLAEIIYHSLPHESQRGISSGTFHQMFNSIAGIPSHPLRLLVERAEEIIQINNYRSKELNHRKLQKKSAMIASVRTQKGKSYMELKPADSEHSFDDEIITPDDAPDDIVIQTTFEPSGKVKNIVYIIHMMVGETKMKVGERIHFQPWVPFDYYKHLEKFGNHWHIFSRSGNDTSHLFQSSGEIVISTPDLWESIVLMQKFLKQATGVFKELAKSY